MGHLPDVQEAIGGRKNELKEYVIGVQVFGKEESFDPRTDPIVRVQARRLRAKLGPEHEALIQTIRGVGYRAAEPRADEDN